MDKKNIFEIRKMTPDELKIYYEQLRLESYNNNDPIKGIEIRKKLNFIIVLLLKLNRMILKQKLTILDDKRVKTDKPVIYAVTHVGRYDIEIANEVIKKSNFMLMGDPGEVYRTLDGLILFLKGTLYLDTDNKMDRKIGEENSYKVLKQNGHLLIFPEGAWNITDNEVVMKLYEGTVRLARRTNAEIIPIAIEQNDKQFYANVGKNIQIDKTKDNRELSDDLRDTLSTLKWEIWDKYCHEKRENLGQNYHDQYIENIMKDTEYGYGVDEINATKYRDSNVVNEEEVFKCLKKVKYTKDNAYLLRYNKEVLK